MTSSENANLPEQMETPPHPRSRLATISLEFLNFRLFAALVIVLMIVLVVALMVCYPVYALRSLWCDVKGGLSSALDFGKSAATSVTTSYAIITCKVIRVGCNPPHPVNWDPSLPESTKSLKANADIIFTNLVKEARNVDTLLGSITMMGEWDTVGQIRGFQDETYRIANVIQYTTDMPNRKELGEPVLEIHRRSDEFMWAMMHLRRHGYWTLDFFIYEFGSLDKRLTKLQDGGTITEWRKFDIALLRFQQTLVGHLDKYFALANSSYTLGVGLRDATENATSPIYNGIGIWRGGIIYDNFLGHITFRGRQDRENDKILLGAVNALLTIFAELQDILSMLKALNINVEHTERTINVELGSESVDNPRDSLETIRRKFIGYQERKQYIAAWKDGA